MSVEQRSQVAQRRQGDVVVLRPVGRLDLPVADEIRVLALEAHAPVVIDLEGCPGVEVDAMRRLVGDWELFRPQMSLACSGPVELQELSASGAGDPLPVFVTVEDAIDSLCSSGRRWNPVEGTTDESSVVGDPVPQGAR